MDVDPPPSRGRKRSASSSPPLLNEESDDVANAERDNTAGRLAIRARITSDLDNLGLIPKEEAWQLELEDVLGSNRELKHSRSPVLLCIIGTMNVQLDLIT